MNLQINGEAKSFDERSISVFELVQRLFPQSQYYAVAVNRQVIPKSEQANTFLKSGDEVEIVHPVGGG